MLQQLIGHMQILPDLMDQLPGVIRELTIKGKQLPRHMQQLISNMPLLTGHKRELLQEGDQLPEHMPVFAGVMDQLGRESIK